MDGFGFSDFGIVSNFVLRISNFRTTRERTIYNNHCVLGFVCDNLGP